MTAQPEPLTNAQLQAMSKEDVIAYVAAGGDLSDVFAHGHTEHNTRPAPTELPDFDEELLVATSVRLPVRQITALGVLAGRDKDGRSGVIREAIDEYLARHKGEAA